MKYVEVITASDARRASLDKRREAKQLTEEAIGFIHQRINQQVKNAIQFSEFEAIIILGEITRLNDINIEAAKSCVITLANNMRALGYNFDAFTNHSGSITIRWAAPV